MIPERGEPNFAFEQLIGAGPNCMVQQDRVRVENVKTASGARILLGVVADGHAMAGESAQVVINHVFEAVRRSRDKDLNAVLRRGLESGSQAIMGKRGQVAVTALAIRGNRYHFASVGHTKVFLIREGRARLLNQGMNDLLGASGSPQILTNSSEGDLLVPGDQMVLASDGLTRINPEDGKPFVDPKDLPGYIEGNSPREAARHMISIAMGRDVDDNVSVIVIQVPGSEKALRWRWAYAAIPAGLALIVFALLLGLPPSKGDVAPAPIDYGYGVILSGSAFIQTAEGESRRVDKLGTIPPMAI
ncbi:MAG: hypothetical protein A2Z14_04280, partial [Chloroflexi bacterium RBG_16_48_8]